MTPASSGYLRRWWRRRGVDDKTEPVSPPQRIKRLQWILFALPIIGGLVWPMIPFYLIPVLSLPFGNWQPVANPPEPASHFAGYNGFTGAIYLETSSGNIYDCSAIIDPETVDPGMVQVCEVSLSEGSSQCHDATEEELASFSECELVEDPSYLDPLSAPGQGCGNRALYPTPQPPGVIVESYHACYGSVEYQDPMQQHIILLEDGTIWTWSKEGLLDRWPLILISASCLSGTAGFFIGLILMFVVWLLWRIQSIYYERRNV
jgi:hypothetical protein